MIIDRQKTIIERERGKKKNKQLLCIQIQNWLLDILSNERIFGGQTHLNLNLAKICGCPPKGGSCQIIVVGLPRVFRRGTRHFLMFFLTFMLKNIILSQAREIYRDCQGYFQQHKISLAWLSYTGVFTGLFCSQRIILTYTGVVT